MNNVTQGKRTKSRVTSSVKIWINEREVEQIRRGKGLPVLRLVKTEFKLT